MGPGGRVIGGLCLPKVFKLISRCGGRRSLHIGKLKKRKKSKAGVAVQSFKGISILFILVSKKNKG